jgi:hypothetical protein
MVTVVNIPLNYTHVKRFTCVVVNILLRYAAVKRFIDQAPGGRKIFWQK